MRIRCRLFGCLDAPTEPRIVCQRCGGNFYRGPWPRFIFYSESWLQPTIDRLRDIWFLVLALAVGKRCSRCRCSTLARHMVDGGLCMKCYYEPCFEEHHDTH